jgi:transcriptional regulator with XRE-family HTH domain
MSPEAREYIDSVMDRLEPQNGEVIDLESPPNLLPLTQERLDSLQSNLKLAILKRRKLKSLNFLVREGKPVSLSQIARELGLSQTLVSLVAHGKKRSARVEQYLEQSFNVSYSTLVLLLRESRERFVRGEKFEREEFAYFYLNRKLKEVRYAKEI